MRKDQGLPELLNNCSRTGITLKTSLY